MYRLKRSTVIALGFGAVVLIWSAASAAQLPDLIAKVSGPSEAMPGEDIGERVKVVVKNNGQRRAIGTENSKNGYMIDLVLSRDRDVEIKPATFSERFRENVMLRGGRISRTKTLKPGETARNRVGAVIPRDTPAGPYCLGIIVDSFNKVRESNEENNSMCARIRIGGGQPDLYVSEFALKPDPPEQGRPVGIRVGVYNRGAAASGGHPSWSPKSSLHSKSPFPICPMGTYGRPPFFVGARSKVDIRKNV